MPFFIFMGIMSCKKEPKETPKASAEKLNASAQVGMQISISVQSFVLTSMSAAADSGFTGVDVTQIPLGNKANSLKSTSVDFSWTGPDANGWYTRTMSGIYNYYEKVKFGDTTDYVRVMSYHGGDGSYDNTTTTRYIKYTKDKKTLYKGFSRWEISAFGNNDISKLQWKIEFTDWNPETNVGTYDWFWEVSVNLGGDTVPYHRLAHLIATETTTKGWLRVKVTFYNEMNSVLYEFDYETPWIPVKMPDIPSV